MGKFKRAPEVADVATALIKQFHQHLLDVKVEYVFDLSEPKPRSGHLVIGRCHLVSGLASHLAASPHERRDATDEPFFCISINKHYWEQVLTEEQRFALVDHELCHAKVDVDDNGSLKLSLRKHDLEEFRDIARRHGEWDRGLQKFAAALRGEDEDETPDMFEEMDAGEVA